MEIKDRELHRITTTAIVYKPDFTYLITKRAPHRSGEVKLDADATDFAWVDLEDARNYDLIEGIEDEIKQVDEILKKRESR